MSDMPPLPIIGDDPWGDTLNAYLSALDARVTALEADPNVAKRPYQFNSSTSTPPASGQIRINSSTLTSATFIWISDTNSDGGDNTGFWAAITPRVFYLQDFDDHTKWVKWTVGTGVHQTGYEEFPVTLDDNSPVTVPYQKVGLTVFF